MTGSGGSGGTGGFATGGVATGGVATGGFATGGIATGGFATGGIATGGIATGGFATGGFATGGVATGGFATGGFATGGVATGGVATGGVATGGVATGGFATGGFATGGFATGGTTGCTNTRPTGTEWDEATCDQWATQTSECGNAWMVDGNYCNESCGRCSGGTGGTAGSGGTNTGGTNTGGTNTGGTNTGGTNTGGTTSTCTQPESQVCSSYQVGTHCGLTYEIWTDTGSACMTNTSYGFRAIWDQGDGNYLARKGVRPGSTQPVVTYSANYQPNGNSYLAIYGWTQNPLVEYYIVDSWGTWRPPGTQAMGTVQVDGGTYEIYRSERVNQPSIEGTKTFWQYWSVRTAKRTSGTITVAPHFAAWAASGLQMGSFYEVSLVIEGYQSSGNADVTVSFQ